MLRFDLNEADWKHGRVRIKQVHLLDDLFVLEGQHGDKGGKPMVYALDRSNMLFKWMSEINEATRFPATENDDVVLLCSLHYLHALDKRSGRRALHFVGGQLNGLERPHQRLHFRPTGSPMRSTTRCFSRRSGRPRRTRPSSR